MITLLLARFFMRVVIPVFPRLLYVPFFHYLLSRATVIRLKNGDYNG